MYLNAQEFVSSRNNLWNRFIRSLLYFVWCACVSLGNSKGRLTLLLGHPEWTTFEGERQGEARQEKWMQSNMNCIECGCRQTGSRAKQRGHVVAVIVVVVLVVVEYNCVEKRWLCANPARRASSRCSILCNDRLPALICLALDLWGVVSDGGAASKTRRDI